MEKWTAMKERSQLAAVWQSGKLFSSEEPKEGKGGKKQRTTLNPPPMWRFFVVVVVAVFSHRLNSLRLSLKFLLEPAGGRLGSQLGERHLGARHLGEITAEFGKVS